MIRAPLYTAFLYCFLHIMHFSAKLSPIADFRVTDGTPFYSWIYTLQSHDLDTFWALDTSGANDLTAENLIYNGVKSRFQKKFIA